MSCTECGEDVAGQKFCGNCGTKVGPGCCWDCNAELVEKAKFCIECGSPAKKPESSPSTPRGSPSPDYYEEEPVTPTPLTVTPTASPHTSAKKGQFVVVEAPKCIVCAKSVYKLEEAQDSHGGIYHKECFRCKTCKVFLNGRERIMEPESHVSVKIANGMFLVAREGSHLGNKGDFFCDKHAVKARGEVVKAQDISEPYRDDSELKRVASMRKDQNDDARRSMQVRVGDLIPMCSKCDRPIDYGQKAIPLGIEKVHESCPSQEESDKAVRPARWFVRKAPERMAGTLTCDSATKHPHTFLYEMDKNSLMEALKKNSFETMKVMYVPDVKAHTATSKKLVVPSSEAHRAFDFIMKDYSEFSFKDVKNNNMTVTPVLDKTSNRLIITKFLFTNNVLQTLEATFSYNEATQECSAETVGLTFEMWPPEVAAQATAQNTPLAELKQNLS